MNYRLYVISIIIVLIAVILIYVTNPAEERISVRELIDEPSKYVGKNIVINGIITEIINSERIYALWDENRMIKLRIDTDDLITDTSVEVKGVFILHDDEYLIDVINVRRL